jgi:nicotinamidase-related amidase
VISEVCIATTMREAYVRDFDVIVVKDGCGSLNNELHESVCKVVDYALGVSMVSD